MEDNKNKSDDNKIKRLFRSGNFMSIFELRGRITEKQFMGFLQRHGLTISGNAARGFVVLMKGAEPLTTQQIQEL